MANRQLYNPGGIFIFTWDRIWGNWRVGRFFSFSERWVWRMIRFGKEEKLNLYVKKIEEDCMMENGLMDISFFFFFDFSHFSIKMWNVSRNLIICYIIYFLICTYSKLYCYETIENLKMKKKWRDLFFFFLF